MVKMPCAAAAIGPGQGAPEGRRGPEGAQQGGGRHPAAEGERHAGKEQAGGGRGGQDGGGGGLPAEDRRPHPGHHRGAEEVLGEAPAGVGGRPRAPRDDGRGRRGICSINIKLISCATAWNFSRGWTPAKRLVGRGGV